MTFGDCVIAYSTPEDLETIGDAGFSYGGRRQADGLRQVLQCLLIDHESVEEYRERARTYYIWKAAMDAYGRLFYRVCGRLLAEHL